MKGNYATFTCFAHKSPSIHAVFKKLTVKNSKRVLYTHAEDCLPGGGVVFFFLPNTFRLTKEIQSFQGISTDEKSCKKKQKTLGQVFVIGYVFKITV